MLVKNADGPSGDNVKYEHAVGSRLSLSSQRRLLAFDGPTRYRPTTRSSLRSPLVDRFHSTFHPTVSRVVIVGAVGVANYSFDYSIIEWYLYLNGKAPFEC